MIERRSYETAFYRLSYVGAAFDLKSDDDPAADHEIGQSLSSLRRETPSVSLWFGGNDVPSRRTANDFAKNCE